MFSRIKIYGTLGSVKMLINLIKTKILFSDARIIRFPFDIRNRKYIKIGKGFTCGVGCRFEAHPESNNSEPCIVIGENVEVNDYVHIVSGKRVEISKNVLLAGKIFISDISHGSYGKNGIHDAPDTHPNDRALLSAPVFIGEDVWIGEFVSILPGVSIGKGSIIGTMSVVTHDVPEYCIAAGTPAKVIKKYDFSLNRWVRI